MLPAGLGALAQGLASARAAIRARWPDAAGRRRAIDAALDPGGPLDPLGERPATAIADWLSGASEAEADGLVPVRLRSADPDDLTLREARLLGMADRIYHRPSAPAAILVRARADAARIVCNHAPAAPPPGLSIDLGWEVR
jgi:uroporphyrin-III C-methyltransferase/precorrin-2 dehydrogenase/sirohydrochlorin ferrochelatase